MQKKHPQFIVAMDQAYFDNRIPEPQSVSAVTMTNFFEAIQSHLVIRERHALENEPQYRQLLPYTIVRTTSEEDGKIRYLTYRRTSKVGEQKLAGKHSIGFGGHIDLTSAVVSTDSVLDVDATVRLSAHREISEELTSTSELDCVRLSALQIKYDNKLIIDDSNEVGRVHVGIVMVIDLPSDLTAICAEEELTTVGLLTAEELLASGIDLENWSKMYLQHVIEAS